jgi:hypothetical protein
MNVCEVQLSINPATDTDDEFLNVQMSQEVINNDPNQMVKNVIDTMIVTAVDRVESKRRFVTPSTRAKVPKDIIEFVEKVKPGMRNEIISLRKRSRWLVILMLWMEKYQNELKITKNVFKYLFKLYRVVVGSFLCLFTYQQCDILLSKWACFTSAFEWFVFSFNCVTFVMFMILNGVEIHRESYLIRELSIEPSKQTIEEFVQTHPEYQNDSKGQNLIEQIESWNYKQYVLTCVCVCMFILNFIFSSVYTFQQTFDNFNGNKTITSLLSNTMLLTTDLINSVLVVKDTIYSDLITAISTYETQRVCYNNINVLTVFLNEKNMFGQRRRDKNLIKKMKAFQTN